ncbi:uncharacterized protein PV07_11050 [Cladophialophora immunda]|uniref:Uncharacterized protein n=1 Tax=Cladophialophora immunda TaxID=569365 RepID=A0A0D1Z578_9EURO|nr:uncharacterized protein PV07_11050 [Cladophialophora immunda]KIW22786.1 hypothetical protein PV07_11050 [Cladophialophora immunda]OQU93988.1 hypothetical protein CLAIMM_00413 [Cladophialophora immunda]
METAENELLVHVSAPSTAQDDRRYISIAQSVLNFGPAIITRVSGFSPLSVSGEELDGNDEPEAPVNTRRSFSRRPSLPRPNTAPELTSSGDRTGLPPAGAVRRRASETSISDSFSAYCNPNGRSADVGAQGVKNISASLSESQPSVASTEHLLASTNTERRRKKPRTEIESCNVGVVNRSAPRASDGDETDSTESASSSQLSVYGTLRARARKPQPAESRCVIDLTSPDRCERPVHVGPVARQVELNSHPSPVAPIASYADSAPRLQQVHHQIRLLPADVRPPNPLGGQLRFTTHITETLKKLTNGKAPLLKHFRPAVVHRDVKVLERGHWQFWIKTAAESIVKESRQPPRATLKLLGSTARKKRKKAVGEGDLKNPSHTLWTEEEFLQFWKNMTLIIESGKVGWATRMTKELEGDSLWKVRVFTWGEMLGHIWMLFLVLSDRLTTKVPMEWISGDGAVVAAMSEGKHQSGVWMRKGPEGERGVWGLA